MMGIDEDGSYYVDDPDAFDLTGIIDRKTTVRIPHGMAGGPGRVVVGVPGVANRTFNTATGTRMSRHEAEVLATHAARALAYASELETRYAHVVGAPDGTVIRFDKRLNSTSVAYSFAAIKAVGFWHLTGQQFGGSPVDDDALLDFLDVAPDPVPAGRVVILDSPGAGRAED